MTEATYRAFSGRSSGPAGELRGMGPAELARTVRAAAGSQKAAAAALGVTPSTFRRWESGAVKSPKGLPGLQQAARAAIRQARMGPRTRAKLRGKPDWAITAVFVVSSDRRKRRIAFGSHTDAEGKLGPALTAYLRGDDAGAAKALALALGGRGPDEGEPLGIIPGLYVAPDENLTGAGNVDSFELRRPR